MEYSNLPAQVHEQSLPSARQAAYLEAFEEIENTRSGFGLRRYIRAVLRYKWLVLVIAIVGTSLAVWGSGRVTPKYSAQTMLMLQVVDREMDAGPIRSTQVLTDLAWVDLIRSDAVLVPVVREQRLYVSYEAVNADVLDNLLVDSVAISGAYTLVVAGDQVELRARNDTIIDQARIGEPIGRRLGLIWAPPADALRPGRTVEFMVSNPPEAALVLAEELKVNQPEWSNLLTVSYEDRSPRRAAGVLNSLTRNFVRVATDLKRVQVVEIQRILAEQLRLQETNLQTAEYELNTFLVRTATLPSSATSGFVPGVGASQTSAMSSYFDTKGRRDQLVRDRTAIERALNMDGGGLSIDALSIVGAVRQSPELTLALQELTTKRAEVRSLLQQFEVEHPRVVRANQQVTNLEREVIPQLSRNLVAEISSQLAVLDGMVNTAATELQEIHPRAIQEANYRRAFDSQAAIYNDLRQRYENARLAAETTQPDVSVLSPASVPQMPNTDIRLQIMLAGALGSLGLGLGIAIMLELMDRRVRYAEQVSDGMQLTILGAMPDLSRRKLLVGGHDKGELVEALRGIRLNLTHAHGSAGPIMATITSPGPGDGKTFLTSNLAMTFAELGMRTLVIDADTRRGTIHRVLEVNRRPGLTDYLAGKVGIVDVIRSTSTSHLDVIPCGTRSARAPELLSSAQMGELLAYIRGQYDAILIDSPPLGAGVDPLVLATTTGNVVLVMRTGRTDRTLAEAKLAILDRLPIRVLGAVLNGISGDTAYKYYSYLPGYEAAEEEIEDGRLLEAG